MAKHLYLIGNGFDIHHGINSRYIDFHNWLAKVNPDLMYQIKEIYDICDNDDIWWSDFENGLALLDVVQFSGQIAYENDPYSSLELSAEIWHQAAIEVELKLGRIFYELRSCFQEWIIQLIPPMPERKISLKTQDSVFINFNYTKTLENLYGIPCNKVLHIHGCVDCKEDFILGHGKSYRQIQKKNNIKIPEAPEHLSEDEKSEYYSSYFGTSFHEQLALDYAIRSVASQKKPVEDIIRKNIDYFESIKDVSVIHMYGLSLSKIDLPYFDHFAKKFKDALWEFSDINHKNRRKILGFCRRYCIKQYRMIELNDILETP